jgi:uncharacterized protein YbjQ (UPF0145 family)
LTLAVSGCVSPGVGPAVESLSTDQLARVRSMEVLRERTARSYTILGSVQGLSCTNNPKQQIFEEEAIERVKSRAALLDADGVINLVFRSWHLDWEDNCLSSIICSGDAIRYKL